MLCLLAASVLIFSSCQKEEKELLETPSAVPPVDVQTSHAEDDACGAILYENEMAQRRMQAMENRVQNYIHDNPDAVSSGARTIITIPVVFHVVYSTAEQNISDAQLQSQIDVLNEDFNAANTDVSSVPAAFQSLVGSAGFHFVLAARDPQGNATTGITRTLTTYTSFSSNGSVCFASLGGHDAWPTNQYLNIWVCNKSGAAGYSSYPWSGNAATDGILVKYTYVGRVGTFTNNWNYQRGRTITHEVGHWLGLIHIWGDAACGDDLVNDTPVQSAANGSCPAFPDMSTCSPNANGDMYMNYMDYTYDACRKMFSALQVTRMLGYLNVTRGSILSSLGSVPPASASCNVPSGLSTSAITSTSATFNWTSTGAVNYNVRYKPTSSSIWTIFQTAMTSISTSGLSPSTAYEFQVQGVCASGTSAYSPSSTFTTLAPACNVPAGLGVTSISSSSATLTWSSTGALGYNIRYKPLSSSVWATTYSSAIPELLSGLLPSTAYEFQVQSVCASGSSAYSASFAFTTSGSSACDVPTGLVVTSVTSTNATLSWASTGALSYNVRYRKINTSSWTTVSAPVTSRIISWLSPASTYEFQVRSVCASGSSPYSSSATFITGN